jgi:D-aminoacyl-tRNA deacylase
VLELLDRDHLVADEERSECRPRMPRRFHVRVIGNGYRLLSENRAVRAVVQRVAEASVEVAGETVGAIGAGLVVLVGVARGDGEAEAVRLAGKVARLRVFENEEGRFDRSLLDVGGEALVVSQFTLIADTGKGNRPSFGDAAASEEAAPLVERFCDALRGEGVTVHTGVFGARMKVALVNDGPVTIVLDA